MSRLFHIKEDDLGELERTLPQFAEAMMLILNNRSRAQLRRCQAILSKVRWNYGPATDVEVISADDCDPGDDTPGYSSDPS